MVCLEALGLDVRLERIGPTPWGFLLMGGAESSLPLTVIKVQPGTPASRAGLADGDEVLRINGVSTEMLTRSRAHDIITSAPLRIELAVIRTIGGLPRMAPSPFEAEVPVTNRTESPFTSRPSTPYRPFSTEPIQEIPPLERPIILSPFYHDNFSNLKKPDFEPVTKFKLEINKAYAPDVSGADVSQSYSAVSTEHVTSLDELRSEMDLQLIEDTAEFVVDAKVGEQSIEYERIVTEETILIEEVHKEEKIKEVMINGNVTATLLAQLLDQTADEISKKTNEIENKSVSIETNSTAKDTSQQITNQYLENNNGFREIEEKHQNKYIKSEQDISSSYIEKSDTDVNIVQESISAKEIIKNFNALAEEENKSKTNILIENKNSQSRKEQTKNVSEKQFSQSKKEVITENQHTEEAKNSFNEIKQHTISTANLLAEQRAYTLGLQTIPNIQGHVHSSYHYDLLLKTFFIHLTDVMVALSRIILAEGPSRSNSPMPAKNFEKNISQDIANKTVNVTNITQERAQKVDQSSREDTKMSPAKFAQLAQLKTKEMTQKMGAVISEFKKDVREETNKHLEVSQDLRENTGNKIEEYESDPLEWLEKVNKLKTITNEDIRRDSTDITATDMAGKIIYVATVEAKQTVDDRALQMSEHSEHVDITTQASVENVVHEQKLSSEHKTFEHDLEIMNKSMGSVEVMEISQNHESQVSQGSVSLEETKIESSSIEEVKIEISQQGIEVNKVEQETRISDQIVEENEVKLEIAPLFDARRLSQDKILSPPKSRKASTEMETIVDAKRLVIFQEFEEKDKITHQVQECIQESTEVKLETISKIDTIQQSQTTESMRDTLKPLFDARRLSQDKTPTEETVRPDLQSQLSPSSTDSWKSWVPVPETPLTDEYVFRLQIPLDESKNPLPPSPPTEHDDPYTVKKPKLIPHIDTSIESKLFKDSKALESNAIEKIATNTGTNENAFPAIIDQISEKAAKPATESNNPGTGVFDALSSIKSNISNASNIASKTLTIESGSTETTRRKSAVLVAESLVQTTDEWINSSTNIEYSQEDMVKQNCGIIAKNQELVTHHGGLIKKQPAEMFQNDSIANGVQETSHMEKYICGIVSKKDGVVTHHGGLVKQKVEADVSKINQNSSMNNDVRQISTNISSTMTNLQLTETKTDVRLSSISKESESSNVQTSTNKAAMACNVQTSGLEKYNCGIITKSDGVVTHHGGLIQQSTDANACYSSTKVEEIPPQAHLLRPSQIGNVNSVVKENAVEKFNCGIVKVEDESVTHHGGLVSQVAVRKSGQVAQVVKRATIENGGVNADGNLFQHVEGTTQGIVDALDNAGILNEELARKLGKPGLTEEKIAELISGEAEMLKEAHVIGLKRVLASHMNRLNEDEDSVDFKKIKPQLDSLKNSEVLRALNDELTQTKEEKKKEERKWTTFLQRPARAVPMNKLETEEPLIVEPYKIKIVKQPKPKVAPDYKPDFETGPLPWEARAANEPPPPPAEKEEPVLVPEEDPEYLEALDNLPESEVPDLEDTGLPLPPVPIEPSPFEVPVSPPLSLAELVQEHIQETLETEEQEEMVQQSENMEKNQLADKILDSIQSMVDPTAPMEEQLVQMRAQLAALAQLPGVISQTLEMVTGQLGHLTEKNEAKETEVESTKVQEEIATEDTTEVVNEETTGSATEIHLETAEPQEEPVQDPAAPKTPAPSPVDQQMEHDAQEQVLDEQMTIERNKKELMSELQFEHEQRQIKQRPTPRVAPAFGPLVPQERPLVLPGGRRWRTAKDAFNEEFIQETLTAQAEIISGKAKGINFLKWEKPIKTLDHLKDSSVYKMIHNMDAEPGKRVENLPPVVLAESEYREKSSRIREILKASGLPIQAEPERRCSNLPSVNAKCQGNFATECPKVCATKCPKISANKCPEICATKCPQICANEWPKVCTYECPNTNNEDTKICAEESRQICVRQNRQPSGEQCVTVSATNGPQVCAEVCALLTKCPQICGGVLPEVCKMNDQDIDLKANFGTKNYENSDSDVQANLGNKQANVGTRKQANYGTNKQANTHATTLDIPIATELVVPPTAPRIETSPRPASIAEAVEIVTNYVEIFSLKESRLTPACY